MQSEEKFELFGYYWEEEDYNNPGVVCHGIYFGDTEDVLDGDKMIPLYRKVND